MSEQDSTLDPASIRTRDNEEIIDDSGELRRARRLLRRNEAFLEQIKERRKKANDGDGGSNQSNDAQMMRRERVNHSQQSRDAGTHRTVGDMEYRRAEKTLKKSREILRRIRGARDGDGEQNNDDQADEAFEGNSEYSGYSKRTYNSNIWNEIYPSRESRKSRRGRPFSRNDDRPERDHRDQRGESYRRRENGFGGRGLPAGNFDSGNARRRRDVPADPAAADEPQRREPGPSAADDGPSRADPDPLPERIPEDSEIVDVPERGRGASEFVPPKEDLLHPDMIDWDLVQYRVVNMMNRQAPIFLDAEKKAISGIVSNRDPDKVRAYGIVMKNLTKEMIYMFTDCLKVGSPGYRVTLLNDFGRFVDQYTFNGINRFLEYPGSRWIYLTGEEFDRIKDKIQPSPPPPRSSGSDGGPSGRAGGLPDDSDRDRSGRNYDEGGRAAAGRGRESPAAMIYGPQRRPINPDREARFKREQAKQMKEFEQGVRRNSEPTEEAGPAPAPGPPAQRREDFISLDDEKFDDLRPTRRFRWPDLVPDVPREAESEQESGSREEEGGEIVVSPRARLVPAPDQIVYEKGDSGENQGYSGLPDDDDTEQEESRGLFDRFRHGAKQVVNRLIRRRQGAQAFRGRSITENQKNREAQGRREHQEFVFQRAIRRLRSMGHPKYQPESSP